MAEKKRILIVEDDRISAEYLKALLEDEGYVVVDMASKGNEAIQKAKLHQPDLILMDIMLKDNISGCEAAVRIKRIQKDVKLIYLTSHVEKEMIALATESQADAYLLKPYRDAEIIATLAVIFSKKEENKEVLPPKAEKVVLAYNYIYNFNENVLTKENQRIPLNKSKLKLIELLVKHRNSTVSNEQICHVIWGEIKSENTLRSLIFRTKQLLGDDLILNINGVGYMIQTHN